LLFLENFGFHIPNSNFVQTRLGTFYDTPSTPELEQSIYQLSMNMDFTNSPNVMEAQVISIKREIITPSDQIRNRREGLRKSIQFSNNRIDTQHGTKIS
jgi:hypothetical protein